MPVETLRCTPASLLLTPSTSRPRDSRAEAIVSLYTKKPWAAGWSMNFLMRMPRVTTLVMKLMDPRIM